MDLFDSITKNTLFDGEVVAQHLPLQYREEYECYRYALLTHVQGERSLEVLIPVRANELLLPLVSLLVWSKGGLLAQLRSERVRVAAVWAEEFPEAKLGRTRDILQALGVPPAGIGIVELAGSVDDDVVIGPIADELVRRHGEKLGPRELHYLFTAVTCTAYCAREPGRMLLCGQDQAPLLNVLWQEIHAKKNAPCNVPIGLYLPLLPFTEKTHILLGDPGDDVEQKIHTTLRALPGIQQQIAFVNDVLRGLPLELSERKALDTQIADVRTVAQLSKVVAQPLWQWLESLPRETGF